MVADVMRAFRRSPPGPGLPAIAADDWPLLTMEADRHGVAPLLYWQLKDSVAAPPQALGELKMRFDQNLRRNLLLTGALLDALAALQRSGICAVPFKGLALAWSLYGNPALRQMDDVDILLRPGDLGRALGALAPLGWQPAAPPDLRLLDGYRQVELFNRDGLAMELHWALTPAGHPFSGDPGPFLSNLRPIMMAGRPVMTLSPEDLLPYLCLHACRHMWEQLKWVCDVALVVASPLDWPRIWARAEAEGYVRALSVALYLARDVWGAELPPAAQPQANRGAALARRVPWDRKPSRAEQIAFQLACAEGWRRKVALGASFLRPTIADGCGARVPFAASYFLRARRVLFGLVRPSAGS